MIFLFIYFSTDLSKAPLVHSEKQQFNPEVFTMDLSTNLSQVEEEDEKTNYSDTEQEAEHEDDNQENKEDNVSCGTTDNVNEEVVYEKKSSKNGIQRKNKKTKEVELVKQKEDISIGDCNSEKDQISKDEQNVSEHDSGEVLESNNFENSPLNQKEKDTRLVSDESTLKNAPRKKIADKNENEGSCNDKIQKTENKSISKLELKDKKLNCPESQDSDSIVPNLPRGEVENTSVKKGKYARAMKPVTKKTDDQNKIENEVSCYDKTQKTENKSISKLELKKKKTTKNLVVCPESQDSDSLVPNIPIGEGDNTSVKKGKYAKAMKPVTKDTDDQNKVEKEVSSNDKSQKTENKSTSKLELKKKQHMKKLDCPDSQDSNSVVPNVPKNEVENTSVKKGKYAKAMKPLTKETDEQNKIEKEVSSNNKSQKTENESTPKLELKKNQHMKKLDCPESQDSDSVVPNVPEDEVDDTSVEKGKYVRVMKPVSKETDEQNVPDLNLDIPELEMEEEETDSLILSELILKKKSSKYEDSDAESECLELEEISTINDVKSCGHVDSDSDSLDLDVSPKCVVEKNKSVEVAGFSKKIHGKFAGRCDERGSDSDPFEAIED